MNDEHSLIINNASKTQRERAILTVPFDSKNFDVTLTYQGIQSAAGDDKDIAEVIKACKQGRVIPFYQANTRVNEDGSLKILKSESMQRSGEAAHPEGLWNRHGHHIISIYEGKSAADFKKVVDKSLGALLHAGYQIERAVIHSNAVEGLANIALLLDPIGCEESLRVQVYSKPNEAQIQKLQSWYDNLRH